MRLPFDHIGRLDPLHYGQQKYRDAGLLADTDRRDHPEAALTASWQLQPWIQQSAPLRM
jgi:hypothetical protein